MRTRLGFVTFIAAAAVLGGMMVAPAAPAASAIDCLGPAPNPAPGTAAWTQRDLVNQLCATQRIQDEVSSPAFAAAFNAETPGIFAAQTLAQLGQPTHPHASLGQLVPGGTTADPFRVLSVWTGAGRGRVTPVHFDATDGAVLNGFVFEPPAKLPGPYPGIVITTGSLQGYQQLYFWAAEGLAEAGYMVLTYDVQGQGNSDTLPNPCQPSAAQLQSSTVCTGVPFQQAYNFFKGAEDALDFFLATRAAPSRGAYNPDAADLDRATIGVAGHSLGAAAVSQVGQSDPRVKAIAAWDNLSPATGVKVHTPALGINSEYFLNPEPMSQPPDPHSKDVGFRQVAAASVDSMQIALRSSTHLEYSYIPYILPASRLGERVAFYYTLAWFDYELRHENGAYNRLVARSFDASSDAHAIGAGTYDGKNEPIKIHGLPVADRVSFYELSEYSLRTPAGTLAHCGDMRTGCP